MKNQTIYFQIFELQLKKHKIDLHTLKMQKSKRTYMYFEIFRIINKNIKLNETNKTIIIFFIK